MTVWCDEHKRFVGSRDAAHALCVRYKLRPLAPVAPRSAVAGAVAVREAPRIVSGFGAWDLVTGGGMVVGSSIGLSGGPGAGKSTLLAAVCGALHRRGVETLYAAAEERTARVSARAVRTDAAGFRVLEVRTWEDLAAEVSVLRARHQGPRVVVVDSVQALAVRAIHRGGVPLPAGHPTVVQGVTARVVALASSGVVVLAVFQQTKEGLAAGPQTTHHAVDVMLRMRAEGGDRLLFADKNREGALVEVRLKMGPAGLVEADAARPPRSAGQVWAVVSRGGSMQLARVDAAVATGRRGVEVEGVDRRRVGRIVEALSRAFPTLCKARVTVAADEGVDGDASADLAIAAAIVSALLGVECPAIAWAGRVSVTGDVETAEGNAERLARCERAGLGYVTGEAPGLAVSIATVGAVGEIGDAVSGVKFGARRPEVAPSPDAQPASGTD